MGKIKGWQLKKAHYCLGAGPSAKKREKILADLFRKHVEYEPDFQNPRSFNEKIMWYKLYYHDPKMKECADKYAVKKYVERTIGAEHAVKTLAVWDDPDDIDFDTLPDKFVIKVNWSSGYYIIVRDKSKLDKVHARKRLKRWLTPARCSYYEHFNWAYKDIKPVIYAEEYLEQADGQVTDYKLFMCGGELGYTLIVNNRKSETAALTMDYFDKDFNHYDLVRSGALNSAESMNRPEKYDEMISLAKKLAAPFPFVRVDFYQVDNRVLLGEMTFYTAGGLKPFLPRDWDFVLGEKIPIPDKKIMEEESFSKKISNTLKRILAFPIGEAGVYLAPRQHADPLPVLQAVCTVPELISLESSLNHGAPKLCWNSIEGASHYEVFHKVRNGYRPVFLGNCSSFVHFTAIPFRKNMYYVRAVDNNGNIISADKAEIRSALTAPRIKGAVNSKGKPRITWTPVKGAILYAVFRTDRGKWPIFLTNKCSFVNLSAKAGRKHSYFVVAVGVFGRHSCRSRITSIRASR